MKIIRWILNLFPITRNYGVMPEPHTNGLGNIEFEVLKEDGQWLDCLPVNEYQNIGFDKMACVPFSFLNCLEIISKLRYKHQFDWSDRLLAKMSGTSFLGNTFYKVFMSALTNGLASELFWDSTIDNESWNEWYKEPSQRAKDIALQNRRELIIGMEWVQEPYTPEVLKEALKYSPLWITLYAYGTIKDGVYQRIERMPNHAVTLVGYKEGEYWIIFDHYKGNEIRKVAWDYLFGACANVNFKWKSKENA